MKHPLHPILVHLPIGLWLASFIFDIIYLGGGQSGFATASFYSIGIGCIGALLAAGAGVAEYTSIAPSTRAKRTATIHMALNLVVVALYAVNFLIRVTAFPTPGSGVTIPQFVLSLVSMGILGVSGFLGGMLVYEHGIGFRPEERDQDRPELRRVA